MLPPAGMAVEGYMKLYLKMGKCVKLVWLKVKEPRKVRKERFFLSFQRTLYKLIKKGKS